MENLNELLYMYRLQDAYAHDRLIQSISPVIKSAAYAYVTKNEIERSEWKDIYQEGLVGIHMGIETFREDGEASVFTYSSLVAKRRMSNAVRSLYAYKRLGNRRNCSLDGMVNDAGTFYNKVQKAHTGLYQPEYVLHLKEEYTRIQNYMNAYTGKERSILQSWLNDIPQSKAADQLGISLKTYTNKLSRIRRSIKKQIIQDMCIDEKTSFV